jgi:hypothetical protein
MRIDEPQAERRDREHRLTFGIAPRANVAGLILRHGQLISLRVKALVRATRDAEDVRTTALP